MDSSVSFESATARAQRTIVTLQAILVTEAVGGAMQAMRLLNTTPTEAGGLEGLINLGQFILFVLCAVFFLQWLHRAYSNLPALGANRQRFTPGWVVGYFFVPFANLVYPLYAMREIWHHSNPDRPAPATNAERVSVPSITNWWVTFCVMNFLSNTSLRLSMKARTHEMQITSEWFSVASSVLAVPAALLAISVIRQLDLFQQRKSASQPQPTSL